MCKKIICLIIGGILTAALGVLGHFLYEWSSYNRLVSLFSPVNESTWEHLKLLFFPFLLWLVPGWNCMRKNNNCFFSISAIACICGMASIVIIFYTYTGILGYSIDFLNIAIYFIGVIICFYLIWLLTKHSQILCRHPNIFNNINGILLFILIAMLFFLFTLFPPNLGIFQPPSAFS